MSSLPQSLSYGSNALLDAPVLAVFVSRTWLTRNLPPFRQPAVGAQPLHQDPTRHRRERPLVRLRGTLKRRSLVGFKPDTERRVFCHRLPLGRPCSYASKAACECVPPSALDSGTAQPR